MTNWVVKPNGMRSIKRLALDGAAAQGAALLARPVGARVQAGEIVPHDEVADPPDVLVDDCRVLGDLEQPLQQRLAFVARHTFDPHRVLAGDVQRLASGAWIGDENRLPAVMGALQAAASHRSADRRRTAGPASPWRRRAAA